MTIAIKTARWLDPEHTAVFVTTKKHGDVILSEGADAEGWATYLAWTGDTEEYSEPGAVVPAVVSMRQAKLTLSRADLLTQSNAALGAIPGQAGEEARIEWEYATELRRDHPLIASLGQVLGLDASQVDDLFIQAAQIN